MSQQAPKALAPAPRPAPVPRVYPQLQALPKPQVKQQIEPGR